MSSLADQTRYDLEWKSYCFTSETLLEAILFNLETGNIVWPNVSFINKKEWINNMRKHPYLYLLTNEGLWDPEFTLRVEDLLFNLSSNYLKRQIQLIPMFGKGIKVFGKNLSNFWIQTKDQFLVIIWSIWTIWKLLERVALCFGQLFIDWDKCIKINSKKTLEIIRNFWLWSKLSRYIKMQIFGNPNILLWKNWRDLSVWI